MRNAHRPATLEPVRFGEFLRDRHLISDEQWLAALAEHWSARVVRGSRRVRIGEQIADAGFLEAETIEAEARAFHDGAGLDVIEIDDANRPRSERTTLPVPNVRFVERQI
jgi:hypothetical protein|nr:hypothetical protein [Kofleriaceae bacterium]